ncbi:hypothetical protein C446_10005 [Halobiforma nitratireducens JCM 10879]|uniref:Uncharacterized protein n=1 Tax=Halobiforma nitratireducens JCM 10879 TaxID=1227454 RepID=M0M2C7_9EURY|nr:hypothetical protein C446_10005 [Halobiforma nitratireducens JCM 10879]
MTVTVTGTVSIVRTVSFYRSVLDELPDSLSIVRERVARAIGVRPTDRLSRADCPSRPARPQGVVGTASTSGSK